MKIKGIYTTRKYETWPSWFVVFEWEDIFADELSVPLLGGRMRKYANCIIHRLIKAIPGIKGTLHYKSNPKKPYRLAFIMNSDSLWGYPMRNILPIILDLSMDTADYVLRCTERLPIFWVTNFDFYEHLHNKNPAVKAEYIPLSVPDKYYSENVPEKTIDVIQFGRANALLHEWMLMYCNTHPCTEYVYQTAGGTLTYESTTRGNLGKFDTRKEYFDLLEKAKISLVSSPCMDGGRDFGGADFITPRFYESAVNYCYMIGRFTENKETQMLHLDSVCDNVKDYGEFERLVTHYLDKCRFSKLEAYQEFLQKNFTSERAREIMRSLTML